MKNGGVMLVVMITLLPASAGLPQHEPEQPTLKRYLQYADDPMNRIELVSRTSSANRGGSIRLHGDERCTITEICPVDYRQMRQDRQAQT